MDRVKFFPHDALLPQKKKNNSSPEQCIYTYTLILPKLVIPKWDELVLQNEKRRRGGIEHTMHWHNEARRKPLVRTDSLSLSFVISLTDGTYLNSGSRDCTVAATTPFRSQFYSRAAYQSKYNETI